jgi:hypothetical protein
VRFEEEAVALGVLQVCGDGVDRAYIEEWATPLGVTDLWRELLRKVQA